MVQFKAFLESFRSAISQLRNLRRERLGKRALSRAWPPRTGSNALFVDESHPVRTHQSGHDVSENSGGWIKSRYGARRCAIGRTW